jgi:hypothetical protein
MGRGIIFARTDKSFGNVEGADMKTRFSRYQQEEGAIGYIVLWLLGVPASVLFLVFLVRGCT